MGNWLARVDSVDGKADAAMMAQVKEEKKKRLYLKRTSVGKEMRVGWIDGWGSTIPHYLQGFIVGGLGCLPFCSIHTHSYDKLIELAIGYSVSKVLAAAAAATLAFKEEIEMCIQ